MDRGAWWAAVHRVAQSQTRLKRHSMHALEKEMATHSSFLAWRIPGMEKPGGLLSMGLHRVRHSWKDLAATAAVWLVCVLACFSLGLSCMEIFVSLGLGCLFPFPCCGNFKNFLKPFVFLKPFAFLFFFWDPYNSNIGTKCTGTRTASAAGIMALSESFSKPLVAGNQKASLASLSP